MWWHDYEGNLKLYSVLQPSQYYVQRTFATHPWSATTVGNSEVKLLTDDKCVFVPTPEDNDQEIRIKYEVEPDDGEDVDDERDTDPLVTVTGGTGTIFLNADWVPDRQRNALDEVSRGTQCNHVAYDRRNGGGWNQ